MSRVRGPTAEFGRTEVKKTLGIIGAVLTCPRLLAIALGLIVGAAAAVAQEGGAETMGYVLGDTAAPVAIIEFGDFACSACAGFWRDTWPKVRTELIETGRVVWRHIPFVVGFRRGKEAANAGECAGEQDGFWPMHELLFETQQEWTDARHPEDVFRRLAGEARLDVETFDACYRDNRGGDRTKAANRIARRGRIRATPTFFINRHPVVGAVPYELLLELVVEAERGGSSPPPAP